ncbi:hypothetical protein T06_10074 [Trichinella sp. T6]|nr:hypothetical protein T06_10074 [Trichinella sp. T6]
MLTAVGTCKIKVEFQLCNVGQQEKQQQHAFLFVDLKNQPLQASQQAPKCLLHTQLLICDAGCAALRCFSSRSLAGNQSSHPATAISSSTGVETDGLLMDVFDFSMKKDVKIAGLGGERLLSDNGQAMVCNNQLLEL